ncbi:hypothetical protein GCM10020331_065960 [Ectobacillus funiculus]
MANRFSIVKNKYVYLSHDDGWYNKIYYRRLPDFAAALSKNCSIQARLVRKKRKIYVISKRLKMYPAIAREVMEQLIPLTEDGLLIDLVHKEESKRGLEIPVYVVGSYENMDEIFLRISYSFEKRLLNREFFYLIKRSRMEMDDGLKKT